MVVTDGLETFVPSRIFLYFFFGLNPVINCSAFRFFTLEIELVRPSFYLRSGWLAASNITHGHIPSVKFRTCVLRRCRGQLVLAAGVEIPIVTQTLRPVTWSRMRYSPSEDLSNFSIYALAAPKSFAAPSQRIPPSGSVLKMSRG